MVLAPLQDRTYSPQCPQSVVAGCHYWVAHNGNKAITALSPVVIFLSSQLYNVLVRGKLKTLARVAQWVSRAGEHQTSNLITASAAKSTAASHV
jgi:hypothetical protein